MRLRKRLQYHWQGLTGEEDTPFDDDMPAWIVSILAHLGLLAILALFFTELPRDERPLELITTIAEPVPEEPPRDFFFSEIEREEIGSNGLENMEMASAVAEIAEEFTEIVAEEEITEPVDVEWSEIEIVESQIEADLAIETDPNIVIQGAAGVGVTGTSGAIDRITQEIIDSLEQRETLVVWLLDQSASLSAQRSKIQGRLRRIYEELDYIESQGDFRFDAAGVAPLLSSVVSFGENITEKIPPTADVASLQQSVADIDDDTSGVERVFETVFQAATKYRSYATGPNRRNVLFVLFTDEAGDDPTVMQDGMTMLDAAVQQCRKSQIRVFVVGVPSPFGRQQVEVKWVDPDPAYDQTPQWTMVRQGAESFLPERLKLAFPGQRRREEPLDSGFGPFALTRLAVETGGIYFSIHPNRQPDFPGVQLVRRNELSHLSSYIKYFFPAETMRRYRPDYVSAEAYHRMLRENAAKASLVRAAALSWTRPMKAPRTTFPKKSESELVASLSEAQQNSAKVLAGTLQMMLFELQRGEEDRDQIRRPRWQAGFDLAMGRALAAVVRAQGYNLMLAQARRGMQFQNPKNDTWVIQPSDVIRSGSAIAKQAVKAREYLQRVIVQHPDTPWCLLAKRELETPLGWEWTETFTNVSPPPRPREAPNNNPRSRPDDTVRMIERKQSRPPPRL
ncbi:MAG: vWA domain-containing protein [Planctomycetota bacterium]|nr:vWA domain-containing protein [Planctomycetota bacterium]